MAARNDGAGAYRSGDGLTPRLYLVRHGETEWSLSARHTGRTDIPLTPRGEDEARRLRPMLEHVQFAAVLTSPRQRARRTCELAGLDPTAKVEPDLAEWDYGDYEGQRSADIRKARPGWNVFRDGCPHGEMPAKCLHLLYLGRPLSRSMNSRIAAVRNADQVFNPNAPGLTIPKQLSVLRRMAPTPWPMRRFIRYATSSAIFGRPFHGCWRRRPSCSLFSTIIRNARTSEMSVASR